MEVKRINIIKTGATTIIIETTEVVGIEVGGTRVIRITGGEATITTKMADKVKSGKIGVKTVHQEMTSKEGIRSSVMRGLTSKQSTMIQTIASTM